ncbi:MAG: hypothetical protein HZC40_17870 [Chloroflexi bacterium]|nr:hypothetical protein [Chloroflexota bacterium]
MDFIYLDADNPATKNARDHFGYRAQPEFYLLDKTGKILWKKIGMVTVPELEKQLQSMLTP